MNISTRVKLVVIGALLAAMFVTGSAWAAQTADAVKQTIENFGLAAAISGNTITVTNAATNPLVKDINSHGSTQPDGDNYLLNLADITGLTIDWQANLTVTGVTDGETRDVYVVRFVNGAFNLMGGEIKVQTTGTGEGNLHIIHGGAFAVITVDGGKLTGTGMAPLGIDALNDSSGGNGKVIVKSGTLSFPEGFAIGANEIIVNDPSVITGMTFITSDDWANAIASVYGNATTNSPFDPEADKATNFDFIVQNGAKWTVDASLLAMLNSSNTFTIKNNGTLILKSGILENYGTVTIESSATLENNATINNYSPNTINNQGTLTNNGTLNNKSSGKITNTGTIDNANGKINNEGAIDNANGTIKSNADAYTGTPPTGKAIEPVDGSTNSSSGSSGCNTGFGMFALAALALPFMKRK